MPTTSIMPTPRQRYFTNTGAVASGCKLYLYEAGTSTPKAAYTDAAGTVPHAHPITLDTKGEVLAYFSGSYKVDLKTAAGVQITGYPVDNYNTDPAGVWNTFTTLLGSAGSSLIGFIQDGAGAILRTLQGKGRDIVSVRDFTGETVDGVTSNQTGIVDAVAYAYATGASVFWPAGNYVSTATIPNFHDVAHSGPGVLLRGADTFRIAGRSGTNTIYVATTGSDANDGLTAAAPLLTPSRACTVLYNWSAALLTNCTFSVQFAAGTYPGGARLVGIRSKNRIQFLGADVGGHPNVPTTIIDGTASAFENGLYFQQYIYSYVQDIKFTNWTTVSDSQGLIADQHCNLYTKNVHSANCIYGGINVQSSSVFYMEGGVHVNTSYSIRLYSNCTFTIGYHGLILSNRPQISGATTGYAGILIANQCNGHVDTTDVFNCLGSGGGLQIINMSRVDIVNSTFGSGVNNYYNVRCDNGSTFINNFGNVFNAATQKSIVCWGGSISNGKQDYQYFDDATGYWRFGASTSFNPQALMHLKNTDATVSYNSAVLLALESAASPYIGFGTNGGATEAGIMWAKTGATVQGKFYYNYADDTARLLVGASANSFKWSTTYYLPGADNTITLGSGTFRWSTVYAGTGAINTSDVREKDRIQDIEEAAFRAVRKVNFKQFKFRDAIATKGEEARWHFGAMAQQVQEAFESEGLDAFAYGLLCYDEWPEQPEQRDEAGSITQEYLAAGNRYGVRYDELLCLKMASL